jgi:hypothetical protein
MTKRNFKYSAIAALCIVGVMGLVAYVPIIAGVVMAVMK